jgi:hypothetical protein
MPFDRLTTGPAPVDQARRPRLEEGEDGRIVSIVTLTHRRRWWQFWLPESWQREWIVDPRSMSMRPRH